MKDDQKIPRPTTKAGTRQHQSEAHDLKPRPHTPVAICTCDKKGKIILYNDAAATLWGRKPVPGIDLWCGSANILTPEGDALSAEEWPAARAVKGQQNIPITELVIEQPNGEKRYVLYAAEPAFDAKGKINGAVSTIFESSAPSANPVITDEPVIIKQQVSDLLGNEDRYHRMIDEVEDYAILMLDENGTIINWNKGAQKIKGYSGSEIVGKNFSIFYRETDRTNRLPEQLLNEAKEKGRALHEGWRVRKDGTNFWGSITITAIHNEKNEVIGYTKVTRDLTERKSAEEHLSVQATELFRKNQELKSQKDFVEMILDASLDLITVFDKDLRYVSLNKQASSAYNRSDLLGQRFQDVFPGIEHTPFVEDLQKALNGETILGTFYKTSILNGYYEHYYIPLRNESGKVKGVLAISHDNSVLIEAAEKVKAANAELEQKNMELERSNDSLEQFAYVSSHDLQEPLRKIQTFSDLVLTRIQDPNFKPDAYLNKINASANRMSLLINALLNFSRLNKADELREEVDLDQVLDQVINDFELLIKQKDATITRTPLPIIKAIPIQMNQLFYNLVSNSLKFNENQPQIDITAHLVTADGSPELQHLHPGKRYLHLNFSDNGIGFDQSNAQQIFTIFQRLNSFQQYSGTGIGLAICKKIVDNHGGFIYATSETGKGASFDIYLPV
jgi:PAS domain S-box-containing protein